MLSRFFQLQSNSSTWRIASKSGNAADATDVIAAGGRLIHIHKVVWSYSGDPVNGRCVITDGTNTYDFDITKGGPGSLNLNFMSSSNITYTLYNGGNVGKINIEYSLEAVS